MEEHRGPLEYDWRTRFGLPLRAIGRTVTWGEALRLIQGLLMDTGSHTCAALNGWAYPVERQALVLMDLYDAYMRANFKKPAPYPRPWQTDSATTRRRGNAEGRTPEEVRLILNAHGHVLPGPETEQEVMTRG